MLPPGVFKTRVEAEGKHPFAPNRQGNFGQRVVMLRPWRWIDQWHEHCQGGNHQRRSKMACQSKHDTIIIKDSMPGDNQRLTLKKWAKIDWTLRDCDIARSMGRTQERVRQVRQQLAKPPSPQKGTQLSRTVLRPLQPNRLYTARQLAAIWKMSWSGAYLRGRLLGVWRPNRWNEDAKNKYPWHLMNFDLPNYDLIKIWRIGGSDAVAQAIVAIRRRSNGKKARWNRRRLHIPADAAYERAYRAEVRRAERWRAQR